MWAKEHYISHLVLWANYSREGRDTFGFTFGRWRIALWFGSLRVGAIIR